MSAQLEPRRFNVNEYYQMAEAGILTPDDRVELIEGEVIKMSPIGSKHAACVNKLAGFLIRRFDPNSVRTQSPVRLSNFTEPEPDVALVDARDDYYAERHPEPGNIRLIIEVADTTILTDRNIKVPLYARANIPEVWLIDLPNQCVEIFCAPEDGTYCMTENFRRGANVVSSTVKDLSLAVDEILG